MVPVTFTVLTEKLTSKIETAFAEVDAHTIAAASTKPALRCDFMILSSSGDRLPQRR
jgi:hypothetical protein